MLPIEPLESGNIGGLKSPAVGHKEDLNCELYMEEDPDTGVSSVSDEDAPAGADGEGGWNCGW